MRSPAVDRGDARRVRGAGDGGRIVGFGRVWCRSAQPGTNATLGSDGGGRAAADGCDVVGVATKLSGPCGGGGGPGGCRAPQPAGAGGGASVGWIVDGGSLALTGSRVVTAGGGRAGNGGAGAEGQPGGSGGQGGPSSATSGSVAGDRGFDGRGGAAGRLWAGIVLRASAPLLTGKQFRIGPGGSIDVRVRTGDSVC